MIFLNCQRNGNTALISTCRVQVQVVLPFQFFLQDRNGSVAQWAMQSCTGALGKKVNQKNQKKQRQGGEHTCIPSPKSTKRRLFHSWSRQDRVTASALPSLGESRIQEVASKKPQHRRQTGAERAPLFAFHTFATSFSSQIEEKREEKYVTN